MLNISRWWLSSLLVLITFGANAEEQEQNIALTEEFLQYLAEFSDEQGEVLDPEVLSQLMLNPRPDNMQQSLESRQQKPGVTEEVKP